MNKPNSDLLKQRLLFEYSAHDDQTKDLAVAHMFGFVRAGKVTELAALLHGRPQKELAALLSTKDVHGRTPLLIASYLNFHNIVMYLLHKGADPYVVDYTNIGIMHVLLDQGNYESLVVILNYIFFDFREKLDRELKRIQKEFNMKRSDVRLGQLVSPDQHISHIRKAFEEFSTLVSELYNNFLNEIIQLYETFLFKSVDEFNRNPVHYGAMGLQFRCVNAVFDFATPPDYDFFYNAFTETMHLEIDKDTISDPKRTYHILDVLQNFLDPAWAKMTFKHFTRNKLNLQKQILDSQDAQGYTPLHLCSFYGQYELVNKFLLLKCNTKLRDNVHYKEAIEYSRNNSIMKSIRDINESILDNDMDKFKFLLNSGFSIEEKKSIKIRRPLHHAVVNSAHEISKAKDSGQEELFLKTVMKCGADIDSTDSDGWTALHYACKEGNPEPVITLLKNGARADIFSNHGYYPMHVAAIENHIEIIDILARHNADLNARDVSKCTPLHLAAKRGNVESVQILLDLGASIYAVDIRKWTALHYASYNGRNLVVRLLCKYDDDNNKLRQMKNSQGRIPKEIVAKEKVKLYFDSITRSNLALWESSRTGKLDTVRRLVISGDNVDMQTIKKAYTPLMLAAKYQHLLVVKYLIEHGANPHLKDSGSRT